MKIRPVDLPELRTDTIASVERIGQFVYERSIETGRQLTQPIARDPKRAAAILAADELKRLRNSEMFYVTADMADLAVAAAGTLPEFTLMPEDIPTPCGFMYFARPIAVVDYMDGGSPAGKSPIVAASWSPWTGNNPHWVHGGIWVTFYADARELLENGAKLGLIEPKMYEKVRHSTARLAIDNEIQCPFSPNPIPALRGDGTEFASFRDADGIAQWLAILKTAWLLMTQPVATVTDAQFDRAARRRMPKGQDPARVRVITLRRPATSGSGDSDREYHHQWIVRGHWRQQWFPARKVHRPVWIAPHVKGPEGAPLLGGEKVYAWSR